MNEAMQHCMQSCLDCHRMCLETLTHCLQMSGKHAEVEHIRLLLDCAEICQTSANFLLRGSHLHGRACRVCAEICEQCAKNCEQFIDDPIMQACAEACRRCAGLCWRMASPEEDPHTSTYKTYI